MAGKYPYHPDYAVPPGAMLGKRLKRRGSPRPDLALRTGLAEKTISQIVNGIAPISYETAAKLELVLGSRVKFWMRVNIPIESRLSESKKPSDWRERLSGSRNCH